jgi:hypothetical protein
MLAGKFSAAAAKGHMHAHSSRMCMQLLLPPLYVGAAGTIIPACAVRESHGLWHSLLLCCCY